MLVHWLQNASSYQACNLPELIFKTKRLSLLPDNLSEESLKRLLCFKMGPLTVISGECSYSISKPQTDIWKHTFWESSSALYENCLLTFLFTSCTNTNDNSVSLPSDLSNTHSETLPSSVWPPPAQSPIKFSQEWLCHSLNTAIPNYIQQFKQHFWSAYPSARPSGRNKRHKDKYHIILVLRALKMCWRTLKHEHPAHNTHNPQVHTCTASKNIIMVSSILAV